MVQLLVIKFDQNLKMNNTDKIFELIAEEKQRQLNGIELIASENFTSPDVMKATGSVLANKYMKDILERDIMVDVVSTKLKL